MTNEDKIQLLMQRIRTLQNELNENPQYQQNIVDSMYDDIQYYQNQIEFIVNQS
jgi:hypothetical protein